MSGCVRFAFCFYVLVGGCVLLKGGTSLLRTRSSQKAKPFNVSLADLRARRTEDRHAIAFPHWRATEAVRTSVWPGFLLGVPTKAQVGWGIGILGLPVAHHRRAKHALAAHRQAVFQRRRIASEQDGKGLEANRRHAPSNLRL